jgi:NAD(P)-dependent dehydrogenase (short-subunit alcohol dehydrogenase family)
MRFVGKTALITGAGSGIGQATAKLLAREGASRLFLVDVDGPALSALALECPTHNLVGDVSLELTWQADVLRDLTIDLAVVNAGVAASGLIDQLTFAEWRRTVAINLDGAFLTLRAALRALRSGGSVVVVASAAALKAEPSTSAYAASKAGLIQLARVAAKEAAAHDIRVNVVAPGGVETAMWEEQPMFAARARQVGRDAAFTEIASVSTPLKRFAKAEEVAEQICFLLSDACRSTTGSVFITDGGYTL